MLLYRQQLCFSMQSFKPCLESLRGREGQGRKTLSRGSAVRRETTRLGIRLRRILRCAASGASGRDAPWIPIFFKGGKAVG